MKRIILLCVIVLFAVQAHAQLEYVKLSNKKFHSVDRGDVIIYTNPAKIPKDAEEILLINAYTSSESYAYKKAKKIAAKHGANGIYLKKVDEATGTEKVLGTLFGGGYSDKMCFVGYFVPFEPETVKK